MAESNTQSLNEIIDHYKEIVIQIANKSWMLFM